MHVSLDAADAVELGEILAFLSDWLARSSPWFGAV
jgi:hypothetical protein